MIDRVDSRETIWKCAPGHKVGGCLLFYREPTHFGGIFSRKNWGFCMTKRAEIQLKRREIQTNLKFKALKILKIFSLFKPEKLVKPGNDIR